MRAGDGCPGGPGPRGDQSPLPVPPTSALPAPLPPDTQQTPEARRLRLGASQAGTAAEAAVPTEERALPPPLALGVESPLQTRLF
ncbi:zinc finger and BTB domain-containing protein 45-like [Symphalangus syndactylus]|uniref:zinc finger and BTB domain-containing protein 45-like n=1 Tax=Symphalangus syndactylus TaxID=9590 RepID=UPI003006662C